MEELFVRIDFDNWIIIVKKKREVILKEFIYFGLIGIKVDKIWWE